MFFYKNLSIKSFLASIFFHLLIVAGFIFYMNFSSLDVRAGEKEVKIINSYLYQNNRFKSVSTEKKIVHITEETRSIEKESEPDSILEKSQISEQKQKPLLKVQSANDKNNLMLKKVIYKPSAKQAASFQAPSQSSSGEQVKGLIALLHIAIQNKQQYPPSALQMSRQGKVTVGFKLYPDGSISELQLVKTSGVKSLDEAALAAVRSAVPFSGVDVYLKESQDFTIDVVFSLEQDN